MATLTDDSKKLLELVQTASELLTTYQYDKTWKVMGELNSRLKAADDTIPDVVLDQIKQDLRSYYYHEHRIKKAHRAMTAIGHHLADVVESTKTSDD